MPLHVLSAPDVAGGKELQVCPLAPSCCARQRWSGTVFNPLRLCVQPAGTRAQCCYWEG